MLQTIEQSQSTPLHYATAPTPPISNPGSPDDSSSSIRTNIRTAKSSINMPITKHHHIIIVTGPAGCGKTTVASNLASRYGFEYIEGDNFHPTANVAKMAANIPLDDTDRWDWLILLRDEALQRLKTGSKGVVVTCSALKKKYRDVIRTARLYDEDPDANVHFVYLKADKETLLTRVGARKGHYMKESMVLSQLAALEEPDEDELMRLKDVEIVDVSGSPEQVEKLAASVVDKVLLSPAEHSTG